MTASMTSTRSFQRILVTTDLSTESVEAYGYARSLTERYGASLVVLSCIDTSMQYAHGSVGTLEVPAIYGPAETAEQTAEISRELEAHLQQHFAGLLTTSEVRSAPTAVENTIVSFSNEHKIDLIVMASHGRTGIRRALLGSTAEYVLRHCQCPVLIVPAREQHS
jgi:nucleotide-binding universal stress UspA family protein